MKNTITILMLICTIAVFGQSSIEHFENGLKKHEKQNFEGAIKDYSSAIKADENNKDAFYNRGNCQLALQEFDAAMIDYDKTIELDPDFTKAYYGRATVLISQNKFVEALPDLDKTIELDHEFPNALTLRGQVRAQRGDKEGACRDFQQSKENGNGAADAYIDQYCVYDQQFEESFLLHWPKEEKWKLGSSQEDNKMTMFELIHSDETLENWTEFGTMMSLKGAKNVPMEKVMNLTFDQAKQNAPKAKLTFIEKDESVEYPWIIFTIESPRFNNDKTPESQLWYIIQGRSSLYTNFRAVKQAKIPADLIEKWIAFFKTGVIVN